MGGQREYQRTVAAVPAEGHGPVGLQPGGTRRDRRLTEYTATQDTGLANAAGICAEVLKKSVAGPSTLQ